MYTSVLLPDVTTNKAYQLYKVADENITSTGANGVP